jgi:uncharacterized membrane protein YbhN (UPF0104 family)
MERQQSRYYKNISLFIKLAIVGLAFGFIYKQVFYRPNREELFSAFSAITADPPFLLLAVSIALMFLNWGIEAWKWKLVVRRSEEVSFRLAVKAVLSGVTIGSFTPNRFGEFAGRIFYLKKTARADGILMTFVNSASQLLVTIVMGCIGFILCLFYELLPESGDKTLLFLIASLLLIFTLLMMWMYFRISLFASRLVKVKFLRRYSAHISILGNYSLPELLNVFALSLLRYLVFSLQFYLLLSVFDVNVTIAEGFMAISTAFLISTLVPTMILTELSVRGSAALICLGWFTGGSGMGILAASFSLWIINIALPAVAGAFFVFGLKFFRERN